MASRKGQTTNNLIYAALAIMLLFFDGISAAWPVMFNDPVSVGIFVFMNVGIGGIFIVAAIASKFGS